MPAHLSQRPNRRPSSQTLILLALSLLAGLGAAWFARQHIEQNIQQRLQEQAANQAVDKPAANPVVVRLVAAQDLPAGVVLDAGSVAVREFPAHLVASDSLGPDQYENRAQGQALAAPLRAGDAILGVHIRPPASVAIGSAAVEAAAVEPAPVSESAPFSARLAKGRRAITLPVDEIHSAAGLLAPGDLIDLYVSFDHQHRRMTAPLLQSVRVLATGQDTAAQSTLSGRGRHATVTLDTSSDEAIKLIAARQGGVLTALLRQRGDEAVTPQAAHGDLAGLLGLDTHTPAPAAARPIPIIYGDLATQPLSTAQDSRRTDLPAGLATSATSFDLPDMSEPLSAWLAGAASRAADAPRVLPTR